MCLQLSLFKTLGGGGEGGEGEIARNEQFLLFPTVFSTLLEKCVPFSSNLEFLSANSFSFEEPIKFVVWNKGYSFIIIMINAL